MQKAVLVNHPRADNGFDPVLRNEARAMLRHKAGVIVDSNPATRSALRAMLAAIGMSNVAQAGTAADALRRVADRPADIILCDYQLEDGRDGQQLLEEMRTRRLIPLSTAFIVITRESRYQSVVSVAELAPDDYLLKPFTPQELHDRLEAVLEKKHAFRHAHGHVEAGEGEEAIKACDTIANRHSLYRLDALRLKAQTLMALHRTSEAEALYRLILDHKAVPWAKMGLALAARENGKLDEAADLVIDVITNQPNYLAAYDLAASIDEERGKRAEAQQHLQAAVQRAPHGVARQRTLGRLATENGDLVAAEAAMTVVVTRTAGTGLCDVADYTHLARLQIRAGRPDEALLTASRLRRELHDNPAAHAGGHAVEALAHTTLGDVKRAAESAKKAAQSVAKVEHDVSTHAMVDAAQALILCGERDAGEAMLRKAIARSDGDQRFADYMAKTLGSFKETAGLADALHSDVRARMVRVNNEGVRLGNSGDLDGAIALFREAAAQLPSMQMLANATKAILAKMNRDGWDVDLAEECKGYIERGRKQSKNDERILTAISIYERVMVKFGVRSRDLPWKEE